MANNASNVKSHQPRMFSALPPHRHHGSFKPIEAATALKHVQAYLKDAQSSPHLHPDAIFSERKGPTYAGIASEGGLVLHQLRRVEAGLRGELLAAEPGIEPFPNIAVDTIFEPSDGGMLNAQHHQEDTGDDATLDASIALAQKRRKQEMREAGELPLDNNGDERDFADMSYNEQMLGQGEEGIVEGEIGIRNNVIGQEVPQPKTGEKRKADGVTGIDKEARKKAKKERQKKEQKQREKVKQTGVDDEYVSSTVRENDANLGGVHDTVLHPHRMERSQSRTEPESSRTIKMKRKKDRSDQTSLANSTVPQRVRRTSLESMSSSSNENSRPIQSESPDTNRATEYPLLIKKSQSEVNSTFTTTTSPQEEGDHGENASNQRKKEKKRRHKTSVDGAVLKLNLSTNFIADDTAHTYSNGAAKTSEGHRGKRESEGSEVLVKNSQDEVYSPSRIYGTKTSNTESTAQRSSDEMQTDIKARRKAEKQAQKRSKGTTRVREELDGSPEL